MKTNPVYLAAILLCSLFIALNRQGAAQQIQDAQSPDSLTTIHVDTNALLLPVVVRDASGHAVGTLGKQDFQVFDQGKAQPISGFSVVKSEASTANAQTPGAKAADSDRPSIPPVTALTNSQKRFVVFLFDDRHFTPGDLLQAQKAGTAMLTDFLSPSVTAVVLSFTGVNSGTTHNPAPLQAAIMKLKAKDRNQGAIIQCPEIDYYLADQIENAHNTIAFEAALQKTNNCANLERGMGSNPQDLKNGQDLVRTAASQALQIGDQDARESLMYIRSVIHTMSKQEGQKTLILISPGFLSTSGDSMGLKSQILNLAAASSVTISALDVRGLSSNDMNASVGGSGAFNSMVTGQDSQDIRDSARANQDVMAELADGTGGTFIHNSNDLEGGLRSLYAMPEYMYLLEVSLKNVKPNGSYHQLQVKVDQSGLKLQTRKGYIAPTSTASRN